MSQTITLTGGPLDGLITGIPDNGAQPGDLIEIPATIDLCPGDAARFELSDYALMYRRSERGQCIWHFAGEVGYVKQRTAPHAEGRFSTLEPHPEAPPADDRGS